MGIADFDLRRSPSVGSINYLGVQVVSLKADSMKFFWLFGADRITQSPPTVERVQ